MQVRELALRIGVQLDDGGVAGAGDVEISAVAPIDQAGEGELTFLANPKYVGALADSKAGAVIVSADQPTEGKIRLVTDDPYAAFVKAAAVFDRRPRPTPGVHPTAVISPSATVGRGAYIGPYAVIGDDVRVGADAVIHAHVVVYPECVIGDRFTAHASSVVRECVEIGDDVVLQPGAIVGADGFGYLPQADGIAIPIPQVGTVTLGDHCDVGANATVDRAAIGATSLDRGVKLDNLVMVAHGCRIGTGTFLAGQSGLAGSTIMGAHCMTGGQSGATGHLAIGDGVRLAAKTGVTEDVEPGMTVAGFPAVDIGTWRRAVVALRRLPELLRRVRRLERAIDSKEEGGA